MKKVMAAWMVLICVVIATAVMAQQGAPYISQFMRSLLGAPDSSSARAILEVGSGGGGGGVTLSNGLPNKLIKTDSNTNLTSVPTTGLILGTGAAAGASDVYGLVGQPVYNVFTYGILPNGSDMSVLFQAMLTNVVSAGGGTIQFNPGTYLLTNVIEIPNNGATPPRQPSIRITGSGAFFSGQSASPLGGTILEMPYTTTNAVGKIMTRGLGCLSIDNITFKNTTGAGTTHFIKTIYTTLQIRNCGFYGPAQGTNAVQDCIMLGGLGPSDFTTGGNNGSFQGYGTVIQDSYFNRIRTGVQANEHANANIIQNNTFWSECGGASGAIVFTTNGYGGSCVGNIAIGNLVEMSGYTNGIICTNATLSYFQANGFYDPPSWSATAYLISGGSASIDAGFIDAGLTKVSGSGGVNIYTAEPGATNAINNYLRANARSEFYATPRFYDSTGTNYISPIANNDGQSFLFYGDWQTNWTAMRIARASDTAVRLTLSPSGGNIIQSGGPMYLESGGTTKELWLGDTSNQRYYILNSVLYRQTVGKGMQGPAGYDFSWTDDSSASSSVGARLSYTNGVFNTFTSANSAWKPLMTVLSVGVGTAVTLTTTNNVYLVNVDAQTVTLPTAVGIRGWPFTVKAIAPCTSATVATTSSQLIDGASTYSLTASNKFLRIVSDGTNWWNVGSN